MCAGLTEPLLRGSGRFQALPYLPWGNLETALSGEEDTGICDLGMPLRVTGANEEPITIVGVLRKVLFCFNPCAETHSQPQFPHL